MGLKCNPPFSFSTFCSLAVWKNGGSQKTHPITDLYQPLGSYMNRIPCKLSGTSLAGGRWARNLSVPKNNSPEQVRNKGDHSPILIKK